MPQQHQAQYVAQAAAIPYRIDRKTGRAEVLMIRRRDGGKWGIPKGLVDPGLNHLQAAAMEALQEAGVEGALSERSLGNFVYDKSHGTCLVRVYAMKVAVSAALCDSLAPGHGGACRSPRRVCCIT